MIIILTCFQYISSDFLGYMCKSHLIAGSHIQNNKTNYITICVLDIWNFYEWIFNFYDFFIPSEAAGDTLLYQKFSIESIAVEKATQTQQQK